MPDIKSMPVFFIDNRQAWPEAAILLKNLVVWPDIGVYPSSTPVAIADHPCYDGKILVQAGNRSLVVSFIQGARNQNDVRLGLQKQPEQYRIAVDSIIHAILIMKNELAAGAVANDVHPFTLLNLLKDTPEGEVLRLALKQMLGTESAIKRSPLEYERVEEMYEALAQTPPSIEPAPKPLIETP